MGKFQIDATELCWIDGSADNADDLCLHGHAVVTIGTERLEYGATVSATALYLPRNTIAAYRRAATGRPYG